MKKFVVFLSALFLTVSAHASEDRLAVVELFTSQGCSSCPPADRFLGELRENNNVLALAYHVDYWDYIGWPDQYAKAAFTERQRQYARTFNLRYVYTPQMVISGQHETSGNRKAEVSRAIDQVLSNDMSVDLSTKDGNVRLNGVGNGTVYHVSYLKEVTTDVKRGENRGRSLQEYHIVRQLTPIGNWQGGEAAFALSRLDPAYAHAVFVQRKSDMKIIGAVKVPL